MSRIPDGPWKPVASTPEATYRGHIMRSVFVLIERRGEA